jgi:hypothetical protein
VPFIFKTPNFYPHMKRLGKPFFSRQSYKNNFHKVLLTTSDVVNRQLGRFSNASCRKEHFLLEISLIGRSSTTSLAQLTACLRENKSY